MDRNDIFVEISRERNYQDDLVTVTKKLPWNCASRADHPVAIVPSHAERLAVLGEEFGEVSKEVVERLMTVGKYAEESKAMPAHRDAYYRKRIREELIQVAAVAVGWIEAIDAEDEREEGP